jgi:membrane protein
VTGLVGLVALLYVAVKMFSFTERALFTIAGAGGLAPRFSRAVGYIALLLVPPAVLGLAGILLAAARGPVGQRLAPLVGFIPGLDLAFVALVGFGVLWLAATLLYWAAVRARIPFASASVGGFVAALALPVVFWAYAYLQIGVSETNALGSGFLAFPVFLLWSFSSWYALLIGAEIAVAHYVDDILVHGARAFRLDLVGERQASIAVLIRLAQATRSGARSGLTDDELARALRLPPQVVRNVCARLVERGLLVEERAELALRIDPQQATMAELIDAVERDPDLAQAHREVEESLTPAARRILAERRRAVPAGLTLAQMAAEADGSV